MRDDLYIDRNMSSDSDTPTDMFVHTHSVISLSKIPYLTLQCDMYVYKQIRYGINLDLDPSYTGLSISVSWCFFFLKQVRVGLVGSDRLNVCALITQHYLL